MGKIGPNADNPQ